MTNPFIEKGKRFHLWVNLNLSRLKTGKVCSVEVSHSFARSRSAQATSNKLDPYSRPHFLTENIVNHERKNKKGKNHNSKAMLTEIRNFQLQMQSININLKNDFESSRTPRHKQQATAETKHLLEQNSPVGNNNNLLENPGQPAYTIKFKILKK